MFAVLADLFRNDYFSFFVRFGLLHFVLGFLMAVLLVRNSILAAKQFDILARPSERGSHTHPTPRLGGVGVAISFYVALLLMYGWWPLFRSAPWASAIVVGGAYALVGGLLDDILELDPRWKFLFQFAAAGSAVILRFHPSGFEAPNGTVLEFPAWLSMSFSFLFIVFAMNMYNFMDGMDGQAAVFGMIVSLGMSFALGLDHPIRNAAEGFALAALAGSLAGLFMFNHPGRRQDEKTFMGDSGSQFVGFLLAVFALHTEELSATDFRFIACLILLSPFLWDVSFTLVRRLIRHENLFQAHRSHLYQRLLIAGWSHGSALALNAMLWLTCCGLALVYAWLSRVGAVRERWLAILLAFVALIAYTIFVVLVESKTREKQAG